MSSQHLQGFEEVFSGSSSSIQLPSGWKLGAVGDQDQHQPGPNSIWSEARVSKRIGHIKLVQKATVRINNEHPACTLG